MWDNLRQGADTDQDGQVKILFHQVQNVATFILSSNLNYVLRI